MIGYFIKLKDEKKNIRIRLKIVSLQRVFTPDLIFEDTEQVSE